MIYYTLDNKFNVVKIKTHWEQKDKSWFVLDYLKRSSLCYGNL